MSSGSSSCTVVPGWFRPLQNYSSSGLLQSDEGVWICKQSRHCVVDETKFLAIALQNLTTR